VRSYFVRDIVGTARFAACADEGAAYVAVGGGYSRGYHVSPAGAYGVVEEECGAACHRWPPVHVWSYNGERFAAVQFWCVAGAWGWRRRRWRDWVQGFEVNPNPQADPA
jgi:hypothetical protein